MKLISRPVAHYRLSSFEINRLGFGSISRIAHSIRLPWKP